MSTYNAARKAARDRWLVKNPNYQKEYYQKNRERICKRLREWRQENLEVVRRKDTQRSRIAKYGVTPEEFERMSAMRNHLCDICKLPESVGKNGLCVDHNHTTGKVRGLLCTRCNKALGQFKDSVSLLQAAIDYLEKTNA